MFDAGALKGVLPALVTPLTENGVVDEPAVERLVEHVLAGGEIDEVRETRSEWSDYEFHYDLRVTINDKLVYIETRLDYRHPFVQDQPTILVVNIHAP